MAYYKLVENKSGRKFYRIFVSRGRGKSNYTMCWDIPDGWSQKSIENKVKKVAAEFELKCKAGEVLNREEQKQKDEVEAAARAAESARLKTVKEYATNYFLPQKELTVSENTRTSYKSMLELNIYPVIGSMLLTDVTSAACRKVLFEYQKKGYKHASVIKLYIVLSMLFEAAFLDDLIPVSPMLKVKRPAPGKDDAPKEEQEKYFTPEEMGYIYSCLDNEPLKWQAYIRLAADTGARRGEVCGIQWKDIDFNTGELTIRHNLQYTVEAGVYDKRPKNRQARVVDIGDDTIAILKALRREQAEKRISKWVFTEAGSADPMFPQSPNRYFKKFADKYGIADFHPHKLRHTSVSLALQAGGDLASVSARAGHSDPSVTARIYSHSDAEGIRRAGQLARESIHKAEEAAKKKAENG